MKNRKRKAMETIAGAAVGAAIAGPVGAVAGGLVASKVESITDYASDDCSPGTSPEASAEDPLIHVWPKRILVPLDFSAPSRRAIRFAREWADFFSAEVYLLHVVEPTSTITDFGSAPLGTVQRDLPSKAKAALEGLADREFPETIKVRTVVRKGSAFDRISETAREMHANLIVIATRGRTGLQHVLLGSTAERVARHAPCPVLILRGQTSAK